MQLKQLHSPLKIKSFDEEDGTFSGYAAVFNNVDRSGEVILKGAFEEGLSTKKPSDIKLLWQHDTRQPIGVYDALYEDEKGLFVKGRLLVHDIAKAREAHALLKCGAINGLSIGHLPASGGMSFSKAGYCQWSRLNLFEVSIVTFPDNTRANVTNVKQFDSMPPIRAIEKNLREAGFSRKQAKALLSGGYASLTAQRDVETDEALVDTLTALTKTLQDNTHEHRNKTCSR